MQYGLFPKVPLGRDYAIPRFRLTPRKRHPYNAGTREGGPHVRRQLMEILACPMCKGELTLEASEENEQEVVAGTLICPKCNERYPITDSIPNLLPPDLRS